MAPVPDDDRWMHAALDAAHEGLLVGELPIGAVVVTVDGRIIGRAHTQERSQRRLLVHAELLALEEADRSPGWDRTAATLYTTLEPCLMCLGAAASAMVGRVVFALDSAGDGAAALAGLWDGSRTDDLPHVRLPPVTGGVGRDAAVDLFRQYLREAPATSSPFVDWVQTLVRDG